jgi:ATP-dependent exoDNAse (exonuclease V) alpha subunit
MLVLKNLFNPNLHVGTVQMDNDDPPTNIFKGMRIILTQNRDKKNGVVNGQPGIVRMMKGMTILITLPNGKTVSVYPVSTIISEAEDDGNANIKTCYPFVPGYAITICKSQGQTLDNVVVWFDTNSLGPGGAYVALSRVKALQNIKFLTPLQMSHFHPALPIST